MTVKMPRIVRKKRKKVRLIVARTKSGRTKAAESSKSKSRARGVFAYAGNPALCRRKSRAAEERKDQKECKEEDLREQENLPNKRAGDPVLAVAHERFVLNEAADKNEPGDGQAERCTTAGNAPIKSCAMNVPANCTRDLLVREPGVGIEACKGCRSEQDDKDLSGRNAGGPCGR